MVTVTSIAAFEIYDNGSGYTSAKHAQAAMHRSLRGELLQQQAQRLCLALVDHGPDISRCQPGRVAVLPDPYKVARR